MVALVAIPAGFVSANPESANSIPDGGVLRLHFESGTNDYFQYNAPDTSADGYANGGLTQSIGVEGQCKVSLTGEPLVTLAGTGKGGNFAGVFADALGVGGKGTDGNGQPCGRIDYGQTLRLDLGSALAGLNIDFAELDLELKYGTSVTARLFRDGAQVGSDLTIDACSGSDCGPDSGDGDNYRVRLPATGKAIFDAIELTPATSGGAASLEGGADGTEADAGSLGAALGTRDSLFHLTTADGVVSCATSGDPVANSEAGIDSSLDAVLCADPSTSIPYSLSHTTTGSVDEAHLGLDLTGITGARFTWTLEWNDKPVGTSSIPAGAAAVAVAGHWTEIDYTGAGTGYHPVKWCTTSSGGIDLPTGEQWCLMKQVADWIPAPAGQTGSWVRITETLYGNGDPGGKNY